jgi:hypothetical protein
MAKGEVWIPKAIKSKSALKKQLHIPDGETISMTTLEEIKRKEPGTHIRSKGKQVKVTKCLKKRATLAMTLKKLQHRSG